MLKEGFHRLLAWLTPGWYARQRQARAINSYFARRTDAEAAAPLIEVTVTRRHHGEGSEA